MLQALLVFMLTPGAGLTSAPVLGGLGHTGQHSPSGVYISVGLNMWLCLTKDVLEIVTLN